MSEWLLVLAAAAAAVLVGIALAAEMVRYFEEARRRERDAEYRRLVSHGDDDIRNMR